MGIASLNPPYELRTRLFIARWRLRPVPAGLQLRPPGPGILRGRLQGAVDDRPVKTALGIARRFHSLVHSTCTNTMNLQAVDIPDGTSPSRAEIVGGCLPPEHCARPVRRAISLSGQRNLHPEPRGRSKSLRIHPSSRPVSCVHTGETKASFRLQNLSAPEQHYPGVGSVPVQRREATTGLVPLSGFHPRSGTEREGTPMV